MSGRSDELRLGSGSGEVLGSPGGEAFSITYPVLAGEHRHHELARAVKILGLVTTCLSDYKYHISEQDRWI